jgi:hypothetical protein
MNDIKQISVKINRDSVHPGDDLDSHATTINIPAQSTVINLLDGIRKSNFLPSIAGGEATWIIDCSGAPNGNLGVLAQQWNTPRLTVPEETSVAQLSFDCTINLYFQYWCQSDPDVVYSCVRSGKEPPNKFR